MSVHTLTTSALKMTGNQRLMSWLTGNPSSVASISQSADITSTMSAQTNYSFEMAVTEVEEELPPPKAGPRRGGNTTEAWMCCVCKFHNRLGRSYCSNSNKDRCAWRLSSEEMKSRPESAKSLNHRRCEGCYPSQYGVYVNGHGRRWARALDQMERESTEEEADAELEHRGKKDFEAMLAERKPKPAQRDPLTWQRTGDWPR